MRMQHSSVISAALLAVVTVVSGSVQADAAGAQFSADMVRRAPDGQVTAGKMFVGEGRTRMEMSQKGQEVVRISDYKRQMEWILFPGEQSYLERGAPPGQAGSAAPGAAPAPAAPSAETDPCTGLPGMTCRRVGVEDVNGRPGGEVGVVYQRPGQDSDRSPVA